MRSGSPAERTTSRPRSTHRRASSIRRACQAVSAAKRMAPPAGPGFLCSSNASTREREPVATRLPLLLQDSFTEQPVDLVVEVFRSLGEGRKVPGVEGLAEHGGDREKVAQLFR